MDKALGADVLTVILHAYAQTPASLNRVAEAVRDVIPNSDIYAPPLPPAYFSTANPEQIAADIVEDIGRLDQERRIQPDGSAYREIVLIGHSAGAVMARKIFALANLTGTAPGINDLPHWTDRTSRIVLLAATNRGWMVSSAFDPFQRLMWTLGSAIGHLMRHCLGREPYIFGFRRGAPFLTSARLQWLQATIQRRAENKGMPITVQLIGTDDDYVAPTDNVDLATGQNFFYLEVSKATHLGIVSLDHGDGGKDAKEKFQLALTAGFDRLGELSLKREDVFDLFDESVDDHDAAGVPRTEKETNCVVFVIHGIRDRGFWTRRIARHIKSKAREQKLKCRSVTSTYGYFPMGPFLLPWVRRSKVEWLLDQYVTAKALYPAAEFAYVGHSNGTYLLAKALELCPEVRFRHVVFAGSVVSESYDWGRFLPVTSSEGAAESTHALLERQGRVEAVINYVATADWVVAIFPNGLGRLGLQRDLGGAGHNGFAYGLDRVGLQREEGSAASVVDIKFIPGEHSAALTVENWDDMAEFVLNGTPPAALRAVLQPNPWVARLGQWAWAIWIVLAAVIISIACLLLLAIGTPGSLFALILLTYLELLRTALAKA